MKVRPIAHGLDKVIGISTGPRSLGLHMSDLYNGLYAELEPKRYSKGTAINPLYLEAGLCLEQVLEDKIIERWGPTLGERPPEQVTPEGVAYSPDLLIFDDIKGLILGEIKLSWQSSREAPRVDATEFPPKFGKYLTQMKAYCYHLGTVHARLYVFFVNGQYQPPVPELLAWDITFTQRELDENWAMLKNFGRSKGMM